MRSPGPGSLTALPHHLLISDLHLAASRPETTRLFFDFLNGPAQHARSLWILGDLFDAWIGDDAADELGQAVADRLAALAAQGVDCHLMVGNRDFLLGDAFCRKARCERVAEPAVRDFGCGAVLLMHGDSLCTDDIAYQRFRRRVRDPAWQQRMLSRPVWLRRLLARIARGISRRVNSSKRQYIMDVNDRAVDKSLRKHGCGWLLHGHTHRPAIHRHQVDGHEHYRVVLGDWHDGLGWAVRADRDGLALLEVRRQGDSEVRLTRSAPSAVQAPAR